MEGCAPLGSQSDWPWLLGTVRNALGWGESWVPAGGAREPSLVCPVLVCGGCCNQLAQAGVGLEMKPVLPQFWGWKSKIEVSAELVPSGVWGRTCPGSSVSLGCCRPSPALFRSLPPSSWALLLAEPLCISSLSHGHMWAPVAIWTPARCCWFPSCLAPRAQLWPLSVLFPQSLPLGHQGDQAS